MKKLDCLIEKITYQSEETGYHVLQTIVEVPHGEDEQVTVVGVIPGVNPGETICVYGEWFVHPRYGPQFRVEAFERVYPTTLLGIQRYLGSGVLKGIGPVLAEKIVSTFKDETLAVLDNEPERLQEISGIGRKKYERIKKAWIEQKAVQKLMIFLQSQGVSTRIAYKIYKTYGEQALDVLEENPFLLARDIHGVGFRTADRIAQQIGIKPDAPQRIQAGLIHVLQQSVGEGSVFLWQQELIHKAAELLELLPELIRPQLGTLVSREECKAERLEGVENESPAVYLSPMYHAERGLAFYIEQMLSTPGSRLAKKRIPSSDAISASSGVQLTEKQLRAVDLALSQKVSILTGGPGTGKTTTLQLLVDRITSAGLKVALASPTGRAAKRLSEATGHPASTIHRLLGYSADGTFSYTEAETLDVDLLVIDEASMLDTMLAYQLLRAIDPASHLLLVGDANQLPSVGAGDVLRDLIQSGVVATTHLDSIFRQEEGSWIIQNAHRIQRGEMPVLTDESSDFFLFKSEKAERAAELVLDLVENRIPARFNLDPYRDIQVLAPMYRNQAGIDHLNQLLQDSLNPKKPRKRENGIPGERLRQGDKVMQLRNNYQKEVFNGDIGILEMLDREDQLVEVRFDEDRLVAYDFAELDELTLAYCISVHKSQGSEYPCVVLPVLTSQYVMLQRNLLYTAVTRAKQLVVLVGTNRAIAIAVRNNRAAQRNTALRERLIISQTTLPPAA